MSRDGGTCASNVIDNQVQVCQKNTNSRKNKEKADRVAQCGGGCRHNHAACYLFGQCRRHLSGIRRGAFRGVHHADVICLCGWHRGQRCTVGARNAHAQNLGQNEHVRFHKGHTIAMARSEARDAAIVALEQTASMGRGGNNLNHSSSTHTPTVAPSKAAVEHARKSESLFIICRSDWFSHTIAKPHGYCKGVVDRFVRERVDQCSPVHGVERVDQCSPVHGVRVW